MAEQYAKLKIKSTGVLGATPSDAPDPNFLAYGELAINYADGIMFYLDDADDVQIIGTKNPASLTAASQTFTGANIFTNVIQATSVEMIPLLVADGIATWDGTAGSLAYMTLTENSTLDTIDNLAAGTYILKVAQDVVGGFSLTLGANFKTPSGVAPEISTAPSSITVLTLVNFGDSDIYVVSQPDFQAIV